MCVFASFIVMRDSATVHWYPGIDSHAEILKRSKVQDNDDSGRCFAKVEITPPDSNRTAPLDQWTFRIDEATEPSWFDAEHRDACYVALRKKLEAEAGEYYIERPDGTKWWYRNDQLHRDDGPAIEYPDGMKEWYRNGQRHRDDGPAIERADGAKAWYRNGQLHRDDGPAIEYPDGAKAWYRNGQRHRDDGPAIECADGTKA